MPNMDYDAVVSHPDRASFTVVGVFAHPKRYHRKVVDKEYTYNEAVTLFSRSKCNFPCSMRAGGAANIANRHAASHRYLDKYGDCPSERHADRDPRSSDGHADVDAYALVPAGRARAGQF